MLYFPPKRRTIFGVRWDTVWLSAGTEPSEMLVADLEQALSSVSEGVAVDGQSGASMPVWVNR